MRASVTTDTTTRTIVLEVSDVPDVDATKSWQRKARVFRPDTAVIRIVDGQVVELKTAGYMILNAGQLSTKVRETMSWHPDDGWGLGQKLSTAPDWVRTLWTEAPAGVTSWSAPAEVPA